MIVDFQKKDNCCGCTACVSSCSKKALFMQEDLNGFLYPVLDTDKCVSCGLCVKVCDFNNDEHYSHGLNPISAYAIKHKDEAVRGESRSGGIFTAITDYILEQKGCVFGAAFDENYNVHHIKCETKTARDLLRGSKYVQSDLSLIYKEVKNELNTGRLVGFSGTACQVAGLCRFLRKDYDNLITFDLVCHGVPSPKLWRDYIKYIVCKYNIKIIKADFRDKQLLGWDAHIESYSSHKCKIYRREYTELFLKNLSLRESCFSCKYTNLSRPGDFTLADFWGVDTHFEEFDDNKGVSLLFVNSTKAEDIFNTESVQSKLYIRKCQNFDFVHPNLKHPEKKPESYADFWSEYREKGIEYVIKRYSYASYSALVRKKIYYVKTYLKRRILGQ